jgi:tetratricopeptide (TPR) repeat protein
MVRTAKAAVPIALAVMICLAVCAGGASQEEEQAAELDRQRLIAAAHYENDDFAAAAETLRRCVVLAPGSADDRFNLALALMRGNLHQEALQVLDQTEELDAGMVGIHYLRGIIDKREGRYESAVASLLKVIEKDRDCFGAYYNLGFCYKSLEEYDQATAAFTRAAEIDPAHPSVHYQLITVARRMGDVESARRHSEIFDRIKDTVDESEKTVEALERSRYSQLIEARRLGPDLEPAPAGDIKLVDVTAAAGLTPVEPPDVEEHLPRRLPLADLDSESLHRRWVPAIGGAVALADIDADGDLDIYSVGCAPTSDASANRLLRNDSAGQFTDVTDRYGVGSRQRGLDAVFGDLDNDGHDDLYVVNDGPNLLFRRQGDGVLQVISGNGGTAALALVSRTEPLPDSYSVSVEVESDEAEGACSFIVLDYQDADDYRVAGVDISQGLLMVAHFDGAWVVDRQLEAPVSGSVKLQVEVSGSQVSIGAEGVETGISFTYQQPLNRGPVGLASRAAQASFDNLLVTDLETGGELVSQSFAGGSVEPLAPKSGSWEVVDWGFVEVSSAARVDEPLLGRKAMMIDYDHDNDLDLLVVNDVELDDLPDLENAQVPEDLYGQVNTLLRNNGDGSFSDLTDAAGLLVDMAQSRDAVFADLDGDADSDLLVANADAPSRLFLNQRLGRFAPGGSLEPPLTNGTTAVAVADLDRDGRLDLVVARGDRLDLYRNHGDAHFTGTTVVTAAAGIDSIDVVDLNNDGWPDLLLAGTAGVRLLAGNGKASFTEVTAQVGLDQDLDVADLAVADIDGDGDQDIVLQTRDTGLRLLDNQGGNRRHWLLVRPLGRKVNRNGYGATIEIAAGGHYQKRVVSEGPVHFGLGDLTAVDVVRITWPNGVTQNLVDPAVDTRLTIAEYVKVSASCGFLWTDNGTGFQLINEILGIGPLGAPIAPGVYHQPDSTELTKIEADQLVSRDGFYNLRLTEELREIMFADQLTLRVVDHPIDLEVVANEMFTAPPFPEDTFFAVAGARPPRTAVDDHGHDVIDLISHRDGRYPVSGLVSRYDGLAEEHALILDLGDLSGADQVLLLLDGWIYWPDASTVMALAQDPRYSLQLPSIQARSRTGEWQTVIPAVGLPTSKGLVVPVDLTGLVPVERPQIRLVTNMRIYYDRILVATEDHAAICQVSELMVVAADLHYRGFSSMVRDELGYESFDYHDVSPTGSWSPPRGMMTRYGDVTRLLLEIDDRFVIFGPGDEISLRFDGRRLPRLPDGWVRDYIFYANGWVKDGDLSTVHSETVAPLPFHTMSGYPYPDTEQYPEALADYQEEYNTRPAVATVGALR